jgi:hypothetical protein
MRVPYIIPFFICVCCQNTSEKVLHNSEHRFEFNLMDSLGAISIAYPERTDTFFTWIQRSDCGKPCEHSDYRFQSKKSRIFKESGFYWVGEPEDSVDQLTIYHQRPDTVIRKSIQFDDSLVIQHHKDWLQGALQQVNIANVLSDTLIKIGERYFYVLRTADFNKKTDIRERRLIAYTYVNGWQIQFQYKLMTRKYDSLLKKFFERSFENLATVQIKNSG